MAAKEFNPFDNPKWNEETVIKFNAINVSDTTVININHIKHSKCDFINYFLYECKCPENYKSKSKDNQIT